MGSPRLRLLHISLPPHPESDAALVEAARRNLVVFGTLYERYRDDVLRYCFYCLGDWDEAADATQQVFANAMAALPRFVDRDDSFRPWLFRIAHNEVCSRHQQRARHPTSPWADATAVVDPTPSPEILAIAADDHERLRLLIRALPPDRRQVCELRFAGLTDKQIAHLLGKSEGAVRTAQSRAIAQLRDLLGRSLARSGGAHA